MVYLYEIIIKTTVALSTVLALLLIFKYHKLNFFLKVVGIYIIVGASIDIVSTALYYEKENNLQFLHLFTLFEFVILSYLFKNLFELLKSKINILYLSIPSTIFIIINAWLIQNIESLNSYSSILSSIIIIGFCIHFFILILDIDIKNFQFITLKWFIICLFLYHSISIIVMLFGGIILSISRDVVTTIWGFRSVVIMATKIVISICFIKLFFFNSNLELNE